MVISVNGTPITLDLDSILVWMLVGLVAGFLASHLALGHGLGLFWDIIVGIVGGLFGGTGEPHADPAESTRVRGDGKGLRIHRDEAGLVVERGLDRYRFAFGRAHGEDPAMHAKGRLAPGLDLFGLRQGQAQAPELL